MAQTPRAKKAQEIAGWLIAALIAGGAYWYFNHGPPPTPPAVVDSEWSSALTGDLPERREQVRQAALDYIAAHHPSARPRGVATYWIGEAFYLATVDLPESPAVELAVRRFYPAAGQPYWAAHAMTGGVPGAASAAAWRELRSINRLNERD